MDKTEKRISLYSSLLIALAMTSPRLLALRDNSFVAQFWHFNLPELIFQLVYNAAFCYLIFFLNLKSDVVRSKKRVYYYVISGILMIVCCFVGGVFQRKFFMNLQLRGIYWWGYYTRFLLSTIFVAIIIKIVLLIRTSKQKESENNQLKTAYLEAELELLKEQLNPHFLFNSLSSLSGIVREDPAMAQHFISHLSKVFRYALARQQEHLVSIADELNMLKSYEQLLKMRFEDAFKLETAIDSKYLAFTIPHLSLQPLLENAAKHNSASLSKPLTVKIFIDDNEDLAITNNLQEITEPESSTGIGLVNLNSRFRILMHREIEIEKTKENFTVKLPLKK